MRYEFYLKVGGAEKRLSAVYAGIDYVTVWRYAGVLPENAVEQRFAHVGFFGKCRDVNVASEIFFDVVERSGKPLRIPVGCCRRRIRSYTA